MIADNSYFSMDSEKEEERVKIVLNVIATCVHMYVVPIVVLFWTHWGHLLYKQKLVKSKDRLKLGNLMLIITAKSKKYG